MISLEQQARLIEAALIARRSAYAPYSHFTVGAALLDVDGQIYCGCNVENASYGLTVCAERVAVGNAVAAGAREWTALAVAAEGTTPPCGACRQVLKEFVADLPILLVAAETRQSPELTTLAALLPWPFEKH